MHSLAVSRRQTAAGILLRFRSERIRIRFVSGRRDESFD
jgi:hypothetical protein